MHQRQIICETRFQARITMKLRLFTLIVLCIASASETHKIGLLTVATGKYLQFIPPLISSARTHFCKNHEVTFFVFTDGCLDEAKDLVVLPHKRYGWPLDTLFRYLAYWNHRQDLASMDYLFACDADMLFVNEVGDEILSNRVGTLNPGYVGRRGDYEVRPQSTAYVGPHEGEFYFAGGFYGGKCTSFFDMLSNLLNLASIDLNKGIIAVWHDESYLNRYFIDHKPSLVLPRAYCARPFDQPQKLIALDKDHAALRT
jgi:histo-blood group ABO system transferase